jgi:hypothetical protein
MIISFRKWMFRVWYWYVNRVDKNAEVLFMNYGYKYAGDQIELEPEDEPNRYSVQLYHLLGSSAGIAGKANSRNRLRARWRIIIYRANLFPGFSPGN